MTKAKVTKKNRQLTVDLYIIVLGVLLLFISTLTIVNLISTIKLRQQTDYIIQEVLKERGEEIGMIKNSPLVVNAQGKVISLATNSETNSQSVTLSKAPESTERPEVEIVGGEEYQFIPPEIDYEAKVLDPETLSGTPPSYSGKVYNNIAVDNFSNRLFYDQTITNLYYDGLVSALSFPPLYSLNQADNCSTPYCGLDQVESETCLAENCLRVSEGQLIYNNRLVALPSELMTEEIRNLSVTPLTSKWLVVFIVAEGEEERLLPYFFSQGKFLEIVIKSEALKSKTTYSRPLGTVTAAGEDDNFLIIYTGYESLALLYQQGVWQDVSDNLGLRVMKGGFPGRLIKDGVGVGSTWYLCSNDPKKPKLVKLWQNGTKQIQGSIDLSYILPTGATYCSLESPGVLMIASEQELYRFQDLGFDNQSSKVYQSNNFNSFVGKKLLNFQFNTQLQAPENAYQVLYSTDSQSWQKLTNWRVDLEPQGEQLIFKINFITGSANYSPWLKRIGVIYYQAVD